MNKFSREKKHGRNTVKSKSNINRIVLQLGDRREFDTIVDLRDTAFYYGKLMSFYGFDMKSGKWNSKLFPITKSDKDLEGIDSDRLRFNEAVNHYDKYVEYLSKKYNLNVLDWPRKDFLVLFRHSCNTSHYKT